MGWAIVNVILGDEAAVRGDDPRTQDLVRQIVADGFEPFSTAGVTGIGLVVSFRSYLEDQAEGDEGLVPMGQYL